MLPNKYCQENVKILPGHCQRMFRFGIGLAVISGRTDNVCSCELPVSELAVDRQYGGDNTPISKCDSELEVG